MVEFLDPITNQIISYHLDSKLQKLWDNIRDGKLQKINEDRVYLVDGRERTGKSTFAFQQAKYLNPNFNIENICFKPEDFLYQIRTAPKGSVIVFDEAFRGLSSKSSRSKINKAIVEAMMEVGQRNLIIFIVLPTLFLLEIYAAVFRSEALFHVYKLNKRNPDGLKSQRGFKIYNYSKKKQLYLVGKPKHFSYSFPKIKNAKGRFFAKKPEGSDYGYPYHTFDMEAYLKKKDEAFKNNGNEENEESKFMIQRDLIIKWLYFNHLKSMRKLSDLLKEIGVDIGKDMIGRITRNVGELG